LLETIREFATERLEASGEGEELRRRHAEFFVALVEEAEPHLRLDEIEWVDRLESEQDNLRAVLDRLEGAGGTQALLVVTGALQRFWYLKSHLAEGRRRFENALTADVHPTAARAKALRGASVMALNLGDSATSRAWAEDALAIDRMLGDEWGEAYSLLMIGNSLGEANDVAGARPFLQESMEVFERLGDELYTLVAMSNLAWVTDELGDKPRARVLDEAVLGRARAIGNQRMEAGAIVSLAFVARDEGRLDEAVSMFREGIRINHDRGQTLDLAIDFGRLASTLVLIGRAQDAGRLLGASDALADSLGITRAWWDVKRNEETVAALREVLGEAGLAAATAEGRRLSPDEAVALALGSETRAAQ
jgi:tetratricopeptide (TPR) repeat protein